jgi:hypothetical protein
VADEAVAGPGDVTAVSRGATRVFGGDETDVGHELAGRGEPAQVAGLGDDGHRGQEADAADGLEGRQQLGVRARRELEYCDNNFNNCNWDVTGWFRKKVIVQ